MLTAPESYRRSSVSLKPIVVVLACWEVAAQLGVLDAAFFPPPTVIGATTIDLFLHGDMLWHLRTSLRRVITALVVGGTTGVVVGLVLGWSRDIRVVVNPYIGLLYPIPKIVVLPITFSIFGVSELARVLTMSFAVFLLVAMNTLGAVRQINDVHLDVALDNGASRTDIFREVIVPGTVPQIFSGLSLGFGLGFILIVVIEIVAADAGLGYVIWSSWKLFTITRMYVALLSINLIGLVFIYRGQRPAR